jgi:hypothetical protein
MKRLIILSILLVVFVSGCTSQTPTGNVIADDSDTLPTQEERNTPESSDTEQINDDTQKDEGVLDNIYESFKSDSQKVAENMKELANKEQPIIVDLTIERNGRNFDVKYVTTNKMASQVAFNIWSFGISAVIYNNVSTDFDYINFEYVSESDKPFGTGKVPNKAIKDYIDYAIDNPDVENNPYQQAFFGISTFMYDTSVPLLASEELWDETMENTQQKNINEALQKEVTHLEVSCAYGSENWDADAEDDGITVYVKPLAVDNTVVPIKTTIEITGYVKLRDASWDYHQGDLVYTRTVDATGDDRFQHFSSWQGYLIGLNWDDVSEYTADTTEGYIYAKVTDSEGNVFEAKTDDYDSCYLKP